MSGSSLSCFPSPGWWGPLRLYPRPLRPVHSRCSAPGSLLDLPGPSVALVRVTFKAWAATAWGRSWDGQPPPAAIPREPLDVPG